MIILILCILCVFPFSAFAESYSLTNGIVLWSPNSADITTSVSGTASCGSPTTLTLAQLNTLYPEVAISPSLSMPQLSSVVGYTMSGGAGGGDCILDVNITDFTMNNTLVGMWEFFAPGYNDNTNSFKILADNATHTNRLRLSNSTSTTYHRRQEGWNLHQAYCRSTLTFPDWEVEIGTPTCTSTIEIWRLRATIAANTSVTLYLGSVVKGYKAKAQITIWSADGDNTAYTEMFAYMNPRGLIGSYAPTSGEINQGLNPMSLTNLLTMAQSGWSIHGHQSTSVVGSYNLLSEQAIEAEVQLVKSQFRSQGIPLSLTMYLPPGGNNSPLVNRVIRRVMNNNAMQIADANASADQNGKPIFGGLFQPNQMMIVTAEGLTEAQNKAVIDHTIAYGEQVSLLWHKVDGSVTCGVTCFRAVIDYIKKLKEANQLDVVTWDDLYYRQYQLIR